MLGKPGRYSFDSAKGPRAFFEIASITLKGREKKVVAVRITRVERGHSLYTSCVRLLGTYLFHYALRAAKPNFKGPRAPALSAMWDYLREVVMCATAVTAVTVEMEKTHHSDVHSVPPAVPGRLDAPQYGKSANAHPEHPTPQ